MSDKPDLSKLPKWAQEHIAGLQRERDTAVRALNEYCDNQTPSPIFIKEMECTGEECGPATKTRYIQGYRVNFDFEGVNLEVSLNEDRKAIRLQWGASKGMGDIAAIPESFQLVRLVSKKNMRD